MTETTLIIACGALEYELGELQKRNQWQHVKVQCLPAELHSTPERIATAVSKLLDRNAEDYPHIFIAYADCGTGGELDHVCQEYGVERLSGAHCYEFFAGSAVFERLADEELGTYYLTDFLVRHFDRVVIKGLGLDQYPQLVSTMFGHYKRVVYLAQRPDPELSALARTHAQYLGLEYSEQHTGLAPLSQVMEEQLITWQN